MNHVSLYREVPVGSFGAYEDVNENVASRMGDPGAAPSPAPSGDGGIPVWAIVAAGLGVLYLVMSGSRR